MRRERSYVLTKKVDAPLPGMAQPGNREKSGAFARAIGADQCHNLPFSYLK